ncbi:MAG: NDP-sugar synthase, partial [Nitrospinota bacterium]
CGISEEIYPPLLASGAPLGAALTDAYWADLGTPGSYLAAQEDLLAGRFVPEFPWPEGDMVLVTGPPVGWGGGRLEPPVLISGGARLERGALAGPFSVLMRDVTLAHGATVSRTVMFPGSRAGRGARLERCIVGPGASAEPAGGEFRGAAFLEGEGGPVPFEGG